MKLLLSRSVLATCTALILNSPVKGHDLDDIDNSGSSRAVWRPERLEYMPIDRVSAASKPQLDHPGLEYVIVLPNRWAQTQQIHVCFVGGSDELRKRILNVADTWFADINLSLVKGGTNGATCKGSAPSEIRIGFSEPGYWSYIGNDSISPNLISKNLTSMNFEGFDKNPPAEPTFSGTILHEFGHALALHHEHQSPAGGCDAEYNWPKLYSFYKATYNWDQSMVDNNLKQLSADRSAYDWSKLDPESNMVYASNPDFLINGTRSPCYFHSNNSLSKLDHEGIAQTYPRQNAVAALSFSSKTLPIALGINLPKETLSALKVQNQLTNRQLKLNAKLHFQHF